jgi:hypothetical protein
MRGFVEYASPMGVAILTDDAKWFGRAPLVAEVPTSSCPGCGSEIYDGFGLAHGGYGTYWECCNIDCDWWRKRCLLEDENT